MKTVDERIENLSNEFLSRFASGLGQINCANMLCTDCPIQIGDDCLIAKIFDEKDKRDARTNTVATSTADLKSKIQELVKQLDNLVELLNKL